jgi:CarD family transcriptional regulator
MQPRKDEGRSRKTTKATTRAAAARSKAPVGAKTDKAKARSEKTKAPVKAVPKPTGKATGKVAKPTTKGAKPVTTSKSKVKVKPAAKPAAKPVPAKTVKSKAEPKAAIKGKPAAKVATKTAEPKKAKPEATKAAAKKPEPKVLVSPAAKNPPGKKAEPVKAVVSATGKKTEPEKQAAPKAKPPEAKPLKAPKNVTSDEETRPVEPSRNEPTRSNSAFARPSPWSAPALPPVRADATKPVAAASEGDFAVGETVVYPGRGVSDIVAIETKDIGGKLQPFYTLRVHDTQQKVFVPVSTAAQAGMRRPISETEIREIFRILKVTDVPMDTQTWNRRFRGFLEKLQTGNVFTIAEVVRDLSRVRLAKDVLSFSERQMLEKARGLIVKEIAIARSKPEEQIREQIDAIFT